MRTRKAGSTIANTDFSFMPSSSTTGILDTMKTISKAEQQTRLSRLKGIASLMDAQYKIFNIRFGLDSILGLFPWLGDILAGLISAYIIYEAYKIGVPNDMLRKMVANMVLDVFVGGVPVLGDIFDIFFKSNVRNLHMVEEYLRA